MSQVNLVNPIDGNQYLMPSVSDKEDNRDKDFDGVLRDQDNSLEDIFQEASKEYGVPVKLLKAVAQAESGFDANAVSSCGASGIMQLMPSTAKSLGVENVFDAKQNITGGAKMLAYLMNDYNQDTTLALAAYNAGSGNVAKYGGVPPFKETQNYISKILNIMDEGEQDTSGISVQTNKAGQSQQGANQTRINHLVKVKPVVYTTDNSVEGLIHSSQNDFTYEKYLRFLEIYQKLLGFSNQEENNNKSHELYQLQKSRYNARALSLLKI